MSADQARQIMDEAITRHVKETVSKIERHIAILRGKGVIVTGIEVAESNGHQFVTLRTRVTRQASLTPEAEAAPPAHDVPGQPRDWPYTRRELENLGYKFPTGWDGDWSRAAVCRGCKEAIVWVMTPKGNRMPLNLYAFGDGDDRYESHFASCPQADRYRRRQL